MSRFNHVPSVDTVHQDAISSLIIIQLKKKVPSLIFKMIFLIWLKGLSHPSNLRRFPHHRPHHSPNRLNTYYGISELALGWFKSYLSERTHTVKVGSTLSHPADLKFGVPQGSVLRPILYLYIQTQSAQSFTRAIALSTIFMLMITSYT